MQKEDSNGIMHNKYFIIKDYPNDIYNAIGKIIKAAQEWEKEYKKLAVILDVPVKNINNSSLNKLNNALKKNNLIEKTDYENLKKVITIRNYINHEFYLKDFQNMFDSYDKHIEKLEKFLNSAQFLIFEAIDMIDNKIDHLQGVNIMRPTVFDKQ